MTKVRTIADVKNLGTIIGIWAHPDDETFSMGGLMAAAAGNGQKVICITATRGEAGVQDESRWPARDLARIRTAELEAAYKVLGVTHHYWLDYPDGGCDKANENQAVQRVASLIKTYRPDSIFSFGPDGMTGHPDHIAVSRWASTARETAGSPATIYHAVQTRGQYEAMQEADKELNIFFNINQPRLCDDQECAIRLELDDELFGRKLAALRAMPSQTEKMLALFENSLHPGFSTEAFISEEQA